MAWAACSARSKRFPTYTFLLQDRLPRIAVAGFLLPPTLKVFLTLTAYIYALKPELPTGTRDAKDQIRDY